MPTVALGCCCGTSTGITLCVSWSACFVYRDLPLTVLYELDGGTTIEHTITGGTGESIAYGGDCIEAPAVGTWTVSISGSCLETVSAVVEVTEGSSPLVLLGLKHKFSAGLVYTDDNGSATMTAMGDAGENCAWRGAYLYYEPDGVAPTTCGTPPSEYTDYIFGPVADVRVEVYVRFVGFYGTTAKFEVQKATSTWQALGSTCSGGESPRCKPSNNEPKGDGEGPTLYRSWHTSTLDQADSEGCEAVSIGGSLAANGGAPPTWFGYGLCDDEVSICDDDGYTIALCTNTFDGFDVTYTVNE